MTISDGNRTVHVTEYKGAYQVELFINARLCGEWEFDNKEDAEDKARFVI